MLSDFIAIVVLVGIIFVLTIIKYVQMHRNDELDLSLSNPRSFVNLFLPSLFIGFGDFKKGKKQQWHFVDTLILIALIALTYFFFRNWQF